jgi:hypothetical protein
VIGIAAHQSAASQAAPGVLGFLVVAGMGIILFFVFKSMARHLRKVSVTTLPAGASPVGTGAVGAGPAKTGLVSTGAAASDQRANAPAVDGPVISGPVVSGTVISGTVLDGTVADGTAGSSGDTQDSGPADSS